jgi:hypothetical protein
VKPNIFGSFVNQVTQFLAFIYGQFESIRYKTHFKVPLKYPLVEVRKVIAPEVF